MKLGRLSHLHSDWDQLGQSSTVTDASSLVFHIDKKRILIEKSRIELVAKGLAEIAYSIGNTNNPDEFAQEMTEDLMVGLTDAEKQRHLQ